MDHLKTYCLLLVSLLVLCVSGQSEGAGGAIAGLGFYSNDLPIARRTSYDVFSGYRRIHGDRVTILFDISVLDSRYFGHIMNLRTSSGEELNLVLVNFRDREKVYLDLNETSCGIKLSLPLEGRFSHRGQWHRIRLELDFARDNISLSVDGQRSSRSYAFSAEVKALRCLFGRSEHYTDVPRIAIRELHFDDGGNLSCFALDESSGTTVHDARGRGVGRVENPEWLTNKYFYWEQRADLWTSTFVLVAHDPERHRIVMYSTDTVYVYEMAPRGGLDRRANALPEKFEINNSGGLFYDAAADGMILYNTLPRSGARWSLARYDHPQHRLEPLDLAVAASKLHHHNMFADRHGRALYLFGGYGNYSYSGAFYRWQAGAHAWTPERFTGDSIPPRFFAAISARQEDVPAGIYYLFGGVGNRTGRQEDGAVHFYDLYRIDADRRSVTRLFDVPAPGEDLIAADHLVMAPSENCFYAFCYDHNAPHTTGYLYRIGMDGKQWRRVSNGLELVSEKIESRNYLFHDPHCQELFCVVTEFVPGRGMHVSIHSLTYPPRALDDDPASASYWGACLIGVGIMLLGGAVLFVIRRRRRAAGARGAVDIADELLPAVARAPMPNTICLMGDFFVSDRQGRDITYRFSSKIRQLFLLILLHSDRSAGISSGEISTTIWPENDHPKNIRGVTIKSLRDILADLEGIELLCQRHKWLIRIDASACHCDYCAVLSLTAKRLIDTIDDREAIGQWLDLLIRGPFLHANHYGWLDSFRFRFEEHAGALLMPLLEEAVRRKNHPVTIKAASCLLKIDPFNEEVLRMAIKAMTMAGRHEQARKQLNEFAEEYFKAYGKEFPRKELL